MLDKIDHVCSLFHFLSPLASWVKMSIKLVLIITITCLPAWWLVFRANYAVTCCSNICLSTKSDQRDINYKLFTSFLKSNLSSWVGSHPSLLLICFHYSILQCGKMLDCAGGQLHPSQRKHKEAETHFVFLAISTKQHCSSSGGLFERLTAGGVEYQTIISTSTCLTSRFTFLQQQSDFGSALGFLPLQAAGGGGNWSYIIYIFEVLCLCVIFHVQR